MLVMEAYDVKYFQVTGLGSRESEIYDIVAKLSPESTRKQFRVMLQNLLAERFHLALHRGERQMQAYDLIVSKSGPKIKRSDSQGASRRNNLLDAADRSKTYLDQEGFPVLPPGRIGMLSIDGKARMQGLAENMDQLAARIELQLDLPVVNATGLLGEYDFSLYWAAESAAGGDSGPSIFSAVESQLGLKLDPRKVSVPLIVIDHIDSAPSGN